MFCDHPAPFSFLMKCVTQAGRVYLPSDWSSIRRWLQPTNCTMLRGRKHTHTHTRTGKKNLTGTHTEYMSKNKRTHEDKHTFMHTIISENVWINTCSHHVHTHTYKHTHTHTLSGVGINTQIACLILTPTQTLTHTDSWIPARVGCVYMPPSLRGLARGIESDQKPGPTKKPGQAGE